MKHEPTPALQQGGIHQRYSTHNWSDRFTCPTCGRSRRYSLNFLGQRTPMCDGTAITAPAPAKPPTWKQAKAAGLT